MVNFKSGLFWSLLAAIIIFSTVTCYFLLSDFYFIDHFLTSASFGHYLLVNVIFVAVILIGLSFMVNGCFVGEGDAKLSPNHHSLLIFGFIFVLLSLISLIIIQFRHPASLFQIKMPL
jgi:hypothetical protein